MDTRRDPFEEMERLFEQMRRSMMLPARSARYDDDRWTDEDRTDEGFRMDFDFGIDSPFRRRMGEYGEDVNLTVERGEDAHVVLADLPGFETGEIDLRFDDGRLTILAESDVDEEHEGMRSRRRRSVRESVRVPGDVIVEDIEATYRNGVLEISLPLAGESEDSHRIDIS